MQHEEPGEVITFYSYTGGSGRSMALANVACLLARRCHPDRGVLMVDWNLESPSLHRFFHDKFQTWSGGPDQAEKKIEEHLGLLDLFVELDQLVPKSGPEASSADGILERLNPDRFVIPTDIPALSLLKAGRFDGYYFSGVSSFQWAALHERAPWAIGSLLDFWARRFRFVLIDSTSGVNDMSGLCAMAIPDKLVAVFTPSRQSLLGILDVARCAADYRKTSGNIRPLAVFPLPSKIDTAEPELQNDWHFGGVAGDPEGYQARFEGLFRELAPGNGHSLDGYFADVRIPYVPRYSYGDSVAAAGKHPASGSLVRAYENLTVRLLRTPQPWDTFDPEADLYVVEIDGRMIPLAEAEEGCLRDIDREVAGRDHLRAGQALQTLATIKERLGRPEEAEAHYLEAIALYRAKRQDGGLANAALGLGRLERLMGRFEEARVYYLDAAKLFRVAPSNGSLASTLAILGDLDCQVGETEAAGQHYEEAIERYKSQWDDAGAARTLTRLGDLKKRFGNLSSAQEHYRQAAQLFHKVRDNPGLAGALGNLAEVQTRAGKPEQAEENFARAAQLYRSQRDNLRLAHALRCLADLRRTLKKVDQAVEHYEEAIDLFRREEESLEMAIALQGLADLETRYGRQAEAQLHYSEATVLYRKEGNNLGVANTLRSLGDMERRLGRFDVARSNYAEAMELYRAENNNLGLANSLQSLGDLEKRTGKTEQAVQLYTQAIQIYRTEGASLGLANSLKSLGDVETDASNLKVARDHYQQAIDLYRTGGRLLGLANALQSLGDLERIEKRFKEATAHYSTARDLYRQERHMSGLAYTCSELARVSHALFDFAGSIEFLNEALAAAKDSNAPSVMGYVRDVQMEICGDPAGVRT